MIPTIVPAPAWLVHGLLRHQIAQVHLPVDRDALVGDVVGYLSPDFSEHLRPGERVGAHGRVRLEINRHGAVSAKVPGTSRAMGLRPGEFNFACPFTNRGRTVLRNRDDGTWHIEDATGLLSFTETWAVAGAHHASGNALSPDAIARAAPVGAAVYAADAEQPPYWGRTRWFGRAHMPPEYVRIHCVIRGVKLRTFETLTPIDVAESQPLVDGVPDQDAARFRERWTQQHGRLDAYRPRWVWTLHIAPREGAT